MKWLTEQEVKDYATTPRKALKISIKHWWQNRKATRAELDSYINDSVNDPTFADLCGLCVYHNGVCSRCIMTKTCRAPWSLYRQACEAFDDYFVDSTTENFQAWQAAAKAMHLYLCSLRNR